MSFWLAYWSDRIDSISDSEFVKISSAIVAINVLFAFLRSFSFAWGGLIAARREYKKLTDSTLSTFIYFFETTNLGRIINRCLPSPPLLPLLFAYSLQVWQGQRHHR
jgi:hypothetical protein